MLVEVANVVTVVRVAPQWCKFCALMSLALCTEFSHLVCAVPILHKRLQLPAAKMQLYSSQAKYVGLF